jgi:SpoVK/Ycf46/Vps4 family AAA+-type ATPase
LGWPIVTIGTSDFLAEGANKMANEARRIFRSLEQLRDAVILIDEVDEFVRERRNEPDRQSRLITTAMLTLLQELREKESILLILATNYLDNFDDAITRPGRFDLILNVLPPNFECKIALLEAGLSSTVRQLGDDLRGTLETPEIRDLIDRFTFADWQVLVRSIEATNGVPTGASIADSIRLQAETLSIDVKAWATWKQRRTKIHV